MNPSEIKTLAREFGIGAGVFFVLAAIAVGFYVYKTKRETDYLNLQIKLAQRELGEI